MDAGALLETGRLSDQQGQSGRAEQYYIAALHAGADPELVYPLLVETCVRGGRLGSALIHAERRLHDAPEDPRLLRLAASLHDALGHHARSAELIEQLIVTGDLSDEDMLYLGVYFEKAGDLARALGFYERYLSETPEPNQEPWVRAAARRIKSRPGQVAQLISVEGASAESSDD